MVCAVVTSIRVNTANFLNGPNPSLYLYLSFPFLFPSPLAWGSVSSPSRIFGGGQAESELGAF